MESALPTKSLPQTWSRVLRRGPPKNKEKSVKTVSETGPSCWAVRILNCVQEMGDKWLTQIGVGFTHKVSSTVLICDAKTWSTKKQREECENCFGTGLSCWAIRILNCVQEMGDKRSLPQSWPVMLGPWTPNEHREECENCFGNWTVVQRCIFLNFLQEVTNCWPTLEWVSPIKALPKSFSEMLSFGLTKKNQREECE